MGRVIGVSDATYVLEIASQLVADTCKAGADAAEVFAYYGPTTRITLQHDLVDESCGWQCALALRVWCGNRLALLTTNDFAPAHLAALARRAVITARRAGVENAPLLRSELLQQVFPALEEELVPLASKTAQLERLSSMVHQSQTLAQIMLSACYMDSVLWTAIVNSYGFKAAYQNSHYQIWHWLEGTASHQVMATSSQRFSGISLEALVQQLSENMAFLERPVGKAPNGLYEVLFPPIVAARLAHSLGMLLTGEHVLQDLRPLLKYMHQPIASSVVTLIDDGTMADGLKSRPVDDEGTPTTTVTLIERGKLQGLLHTRQTAMALKMEPNGKATRPDLWHLPRSLPSNIYLQAGDTAPEDLRRQLRHGLIVTGMLRPARIQGARGMFTLVAQGWWVEQGEVVRWVSNVPLSANIFDLLRHIRCCGNDLQFSSLAEGAGAPSLLIEQMRIG